MKKKDKYKKFIECPISDVQEFKNLLCTLDTNGLRDLKGFLSREGHNKIKIFHINEEIKKRVPKVIGHRQWPLELDLEWEEVCKPFRALSRLKQKRQVNEK